MKRAENSFEPVAAADGNLSGGMVLDADQQFEPQRLKLFERPCGQHRERLRRDSLTAGGRGDQITKLDGASLAIDAGCASDAEDAAVNRADDSERFSRVPTSRLLQAAPPDICEVWRDRDREAREAQHIRISGQLRDNAKMRLSEHVEADRHHPTNLDDHPRQATAMPQGAGMSPDGTSVTWQPEGSATSHLAAL